MTRMATDQTVAGLSFIPNTDLVKHCYSLEIARLHTTNLSN